MAHPANIQEFLKRIFGEDQAKGLHHLSEAFEFDQSSPYCAIVPELGSLNQSTVKDLGEAEKVALTRVLYSLLDARTRRNVDSEHHSPTKNTPDGFTWDELQSIFMQAGYLEPADENQPIPKSVQAEGKRKICWRKKHEEARTPRSQAVYEFLRHIIDETKEDKGGSAEIDLTPLGHLLSKTPEKPNTRSALRKFVPPLNRRGRSPRSQTADTTLSNALSQPPTKHSTRAQSLPSTIPSENLYPLIDSVIPSEAPCSNDAQVPKVSAAPFVQEPDSVVITGCSQPQDRRVNHSVLNSSSSQQYSLTWADARSPRNWVVLELITLQFPDSPGRPHFTISRLSVMAWTSFDRRFIIPRSQMVVRIESLSRRFGARKAFIERMPTDRRESAVIEAHALFT